MTPKEKAQDLYSKVHGNLVKTENESETEKIFRKTNARICALITVYEIISAINQIESFAPRDYKTYPLSFWKSVEEELNNL